MSAALLSFEGASLARGGRTLFTNLDLALGRGDALHVAGPNGSGKSSLLRLAAGLLRPSAGQVRAGHASLSDERLALDTEEPLRPALLFWARLGNRAAEVDPALDATGIAHLADVPVRLLSTGQARRASLARVIASGAPLWLLDEPLNGLDADATERLGVLLAKHRQSGGAVVAASHVALPGAWTKLDLER